MKLKAVHLQNWCKEINLARTSVMLLQLLCTTGCEAAAVYFVNEPEDTTIEEGGVAKFNCTYTGTTTFPYWRINDRLYPTDLLPINHSYDRQMLIVQDVQLSNNGTQYQCVFVSKRSRIATLYVYSTNEDDISHEPTRMLASENSTVLNGGYLWMIDAIVIALSLKKESRSVGLCISVMMVVLLAVLLLAIILGMKINNIVNFDGQAPDMPIYESIDNEDGTRQDPNMEVDEKIPPTVVIELKENDLYNC